MDSGSSILMRRDRLERIAMAERDRRSGRNDVAVASLGEPSEWPARVVLALAKLSLGEGDETRRILEEGLDLWAEESELDSLDEVLSDPDLDHYVPAFVASAADLERPIDNSELDRAFEEAEAQVEEMHDVNQVAERVLLDDAIGLGALAEDDLVPVAGREELIGMADEGLADIFGVDAAQVSDDDDGWRADEDIVDGVSRPSRAVVLATLSRWLGNIQAGHARGMQQ